MRINSPQHLNSSLEHSCLREEGARTNFGGQVRGPTSSETKKRNQEWRIRIFPEFSPVPKLLRLMFSADVDAFANVHCRSKKCPWFSDIHETFSPAQMWAQSKVSAHDLEGGVISGEEKSVPSSTRFRFPKLLVILPRKRTPSPPQQLSSKRGKRPPGVPGLLEPTPPPGIQGVELRELPIITLRRSANEDSAWFSRSIILSQPRSGRSFACGYPGCMRFFPSIYQVDQHRMLENHHYDSEKGFHDHAKIVAEAQLLRRKCNEKGGEQKLNQADRLRLMELELHIAHKENAMSVLRRRQAARNVDRGFTDQPLKWAPSQHRDSSPDLFPTGDSTAEEEAHEDEQERLAKSEINNYLIHRPPDFQYHRHQPDPPSVAATTPALPNGVIYHQFKEAGGGGGVRIRFQLMTPHIGEYKAKSGTFAVLMPPDGGGGGRGVEFRLEEDRRVGLYVGEQAILRGPRWMHPQELLTIDFVFEQQPPKNRRSSSGSSSNGVKSKARRTPTITRVSLYIEDSLAAQEDVALELGSALVPEKALLLLDPSTRWMGFPKPPTALRVIAEEQRKEELRTENVTLEAKVRLHQMLHDGVVVRRAPPANKPQRHADLKKQAKTTAALMTLPKKFLKSRYNWMVDAPQPSAPPLVEDDPDFLRNPFTRPAYRPGVFACEIYERETALQPMYPPLKTARIANFTVSSGFAVKVGEAGNAKPNPNSPSLASEVLARERGAASEWEWLFESGGTEVINIDLGNQRRGGGHATSPPPVEKVLLKTSPSRQGIPRALKLQALVSKRALGIRDEISVAGSASFPKIKVTRSLGANRTERLRKACEAVAGASSPSPSASSSSSALIWKDVDSVKLMRRPRVYENNYSITLNAKGVSARHWKVVILDTWDDDDALINNEDTFEEEEREEESLHQSGGKRRRGGTSKKIKRKSIFDDDAAVAADDSCSSSSPNSDEASLSSMATVDAVRSPWERPPGLRARLRQVQIVPMTPGMAAAAGASTSSERFLGLSRSSSNAFVATRMGESQEAAEAAVLTTAFSPTIIPPKHVSYHNADLRRGDVRRHSKKEGSYLLTKSGSFQVFCELVKRYRATQELLKIAKEREEIMMALSGSSGTAGAATPDGDSGARRRASDDGDDGESYYWGWGLRQAVGESRKASREATQDYLHAATEKKIWGRYEVELEIDGVLRSRLAPIGEMILHPSRKGIFFLRQLSSPPPENDDADAGKTCWEGGERIIRGRLSGLQLKGRYLRANYSIGLSEGLGMALEGRVKWDVFEAAVAIGSEAEELIGFYSFKDGRRMLSWKGRRGSNDKRSVDEMWASTQKMFHRYDLGLTRYGDLRADYKLKSTDDEESSEDYDDDDDAGGEWKQQQKKGAATTLPPIYADPSGRLRFWGPQCGGDINSTAGDLIQVLTYDEAADNDGGSSAFLKMKDVRLQRRGFTTVIHDLIREARKDKVACPLARFLSRWHRELQRSSINNSRAAGENPASTISSSSSSSSSSKSSSKSRTNTKMECEERQQPTQESILHLERYLRGRLKLQPIW
eukprot:jgi/Bigna1/77643/fgenesh1_pg.49_\